MKSTHLRCLQRFCAQYVRDPGLRLSAQDPGNTEGSDLGCVSLKGEKDGWKWGARGRAFQDGGTRTGRDEGRVRYGWRLCCSEALR